jgi:hypothetical protein
MRPQLIRRLGVHGHAADDGGQARSEAPAGTPLSRLGVKVVLLANRVRTLNF